MINRKRNWLLISLLVAFPATAAADPPRLQNQALALVSLHAGSFSEGLGVYAMELDSGGELMAVNQSIRRIPASNQKILTSAVALTKLGGSFRFATALYLCGDELLLAGDGDPTLGDPVVAAEEKETIYAEFDRWATKAVAKTGRGSTFRLKVLSVPDPNKMRHPDWPKKQFRRWYSAPVSALNFNDNCIEVGFEKTRSGVRPVVIPEAPAIRVIDKTRSGKRTAWWASLHSDDSVITLRGRVKPGKTHPYPVAVDRPDLLAGRVLAGRLEKAGIEIRGDVQAVRPDDVNTKDADLISGKSTPIGDVIRRANKRSLNLAAECLFLRSGDFTWKGSARGSEEVLNKTYGLDANDVRVADGSGYSRRNLVTPQAIVSVLRQLAAGDDARMFQASLPVCGIDGSLRRRLTRAPYKGRVVAKTGTLAGVSALSGYILDADGKPAVAFSILVNGIPSRKGGAVDQLENALCVKMVDYVRETCDQRE